MKTRLGVLALSLAIAAPSIAFAQTSSGHLTRAQVRAELVQLQQAGYEPSRTQYPADIQAAEARIAAHNRAAGNDTTGYGSPTAGTSQAGHRISKATWDALYSHH